MYDCFRLSAPVGSERWFHYPKPGLWLQLRQIGCPSAHNLTALDCSSELYSSAGQPSRLDAHG